jgi:formate dehydrogenase subunit gamma
MSEYVVRFSLKQRIEHLVTMLIFTGLCLTGLPQKFYTAGWAQWIVRIVGGLDNARWIHRALGIGLAISTLLHFAGAFAAIVARRTGFSIVPNQKDFQDAIDTLKYYLGLADRPAEFDRYDYKQKWEYWGLVVGNIIMIVSGLILFYPTVAARMVPGQVIPAAKVAHSNEGLMAFLVITIWHIFNAHLNPDVFPFDTSIFTGKISHERMEHEHPLELARMEGGAAREHGGASAAHAGHKMG